MYIVYGINYTKLTMRFTYRTYLHIKRYIHATLEYKFMNALRYTPKYIQNDETMDHFELSKNSETRNTTLNNSLCKASIPSQQICSLYLHICNYYI